jgi:hypothetical protein
MFEVKAPSWPPPTRRCGCPFVGEDFMAVTTETIWPGEGENLRVQKLAQFARAFKQHKYSNPGTTISIRAYWDWRSSRWTEAAMRQRQTAVRNILLQQGVPSQAMIVDIPVNSEKWSGCIDVTFGSLDSVVPNIPVPSSGSSPGKAASQPSESDSFEVEAGIVFDPTEGIQASAEVTYRDPNGNRKILQPFKFYLTVGSKGLEEVGTELMIYKKKIKNQLFWAAIKEVYFKVKFDAKVKFEKEDARDTLGDWAAKFKAGLSADVGIPRSSIKIPVAAWVYVDQGGHPGAGAEFTLFEF